MRVQVARTKLLMTQQTLDLRELIDLTHCRVDFDLGGLDFPVREWDHLGSQGLILLDFGERLVYSNDVLGFMAQHNLLPATARQTAAVCVQRPELAFYFSLVSLDAVEAKGVPVGLCFGEYCDNPHVALGQLVCHAPWSLKSKFLAQPGPRLRRQRRAAAA